jgi:hypothetical protein
MPNKSLRKRLSPLIRKPQALQQEDRAQGHLGRAGVAVRRAPYFYGAFWWNDDDFQVRSDPLESPLKELARSNPSDVMSRYSTSAKNFGSTHVAFGFLMALVSFGLRADHRVERLPDLVGNSAGPACPDLADVDEIHASCSPR